MTVIQENTVVFFRYIMRNSQGEALEDIMNGPSKSYLHGSENIQASLQHQLEGLKAGDKKTVYLETGTAPNDTYFFDIIIDQLRPALQEEIQLGYPVVVVDTICDADCDC